MSDQRQQWTVESVVDLPPISLMMENLEFEHRLSNVQWQVRFVRCWPYFWRWRREYVVEFTFCRETEEERHNRTVKQIIQEVYDK